MGEAVCISLLAMDLNKEGSLNEWFESMRAPKFPEILGNSASPLDNYGYLDSMPPSRLFEWVIRFSYA